MVGCNAARCGVATGTLHSESEYWVMVRAVVQCVCMAELSATVWVGLVHAWVG